MCRLLGVSESGYYAWRKRPPSPRARANARLTLEIKAAHERTRRTYGPERLQSELADNGIRVGVHRIKRIRREQGLRCKQKRRFRVTTDSKHTMPVAPNVLARQFSTDAPNKVWVADLTYVKTAEGWLYLAGIKDLFNGELVGHSMSDRMTRDLTETALRQAIAARRPAPGLVHHSDRGSQYCAGTYQKLLRQHRMQPSMSRKGNCWDNAPMESVWGILKSELVHHHRFETRAEARAAIREYIEIFYNRTRKQARLGYLSPVQFIRQYRHRQAAH
jgi:putative transposase